MWINDVLWGLGNSIYYAAIESSGVIVSSAKFVGMIFAAVFL